MPLVQVRVTKKSGDRKLIEALTLRSFPEEERLPKWHLNLLAKRKCVDYIAYYDDSVFVGFTYTLVAENMVYLLFFAVSDEIRSRGYGSQILTLLKEKYHDKVITLNIETVSETASNNEQRITRELFYKKNGFENTKKYININGMDLDILTFGEFNDSDFVAVNSKLAFGLYKPVICTH